MIFQYNVNKKQKNTTKICFLSKVTKEKSQSNETIKTKIKLSIKEAL